MDTGGRKEETRRREEEGRLDREEKRERIHCIFRTMRIPSIVNDFKPASGAYDRKRVIASREYLIGDSSLLTKG